MKLQREKLEFPSKKSNVIKVSLVPRVNIGTSAQLSGDRLASRRGRIVVSALFGGAVLSSGSSVRSVMCVYVCVKGSPP